MISLQCDKNNRKKFRCVPIAIGLPILFLCLFLIVLSWMIYGLGNNQTDLVFIFGAMAALCLVFILFFSEKALQHVVLFHDRIECRGIQFKSSFCLKYDECNIGIERHIQYGNSIWWIYFCDGPLWGYKGKNTKKQINDIKIQYGFVRIMYSQELYESLLQVLPKRQKTALIAARRCAGFDKQGRIV